MAEHRYADGYDGPDDVRIPREIGPEPGSEEAVNIDVIAERLQALQEQADALDITQEQAQEQSQRQEMSY